LGSAIFSRAGDEIADLPNVLLYPLGWQPPASYSATAGRWTVNSSTPGLNDTRVCCCWAHDFFISDQHLS
jgi:hypothetical protein